MQPSVSEFGRISKGAEPRADLFEYIFPLHCLTMIVMFALIAVFAVHVYRTDRIPNDKKVLWAIILFRERDGLPGLLVPLHVARRQHTSADDATFATSSTRWNGSTGLRR